jgi:hypothetical protein
MSKSKLFYGKSSKSKMHKMKGKGDVTNTDTSKTKKNKGKKSNYSESITNKNERRLIEAFQILNKFKVIFLLRIFRMELMILCLWRLL